MNHTTTTLRIPTADQYAYLEVQFVGTPEEAFDEYKRLTALVKAEDVAGLPPAEWRELIDAYLTGAKYDYESIIGKLNKAQSFALNEVKKSRVRTNNK